MRCIDDPVEVGIQPVDWYIFSLYIGIQPVDWY